MNWSIVETAMAQAQGAPKGPNMLELLIMPLGFLFIMYFFIIRPQQRKAREQGELITSLKNGDEIVTSAGIIGRIKSIADNFVTLEVAANTSIKVLKSHISGLTKNLDRKAEKATT
jgi:preprotein translocase subunit YajC